MASRRPAPWLATALAWIGGCTGTDTGNPPVIGFHSSGCKSKQTSGLVLQSLDEPMKGAEPLYTGLTCFVWERLDEDTLRIDLTNYESGCGAEQGWQPRAELAKDGSLELILQDSHCANASCGWCIYDLSFTVELEEAVRDGEVRLFQRGCDDALRHEKRAFLRLASQPSGAACTYAHYYALQDSPAQAPDHARGLCGPTEAGEPNRSCSEGLRCTDLSKSAPTDHHGGPRCLSECQVDADCDALSRCEGAVCMLSATGLSDG